MLLTNIIHDPMHFLASSDLDLVEPCLQFILSLGETVSSKELDSIHAFCTELQHRAKIALDESKTRSIKERIPTDIPGVTNGPQIMPPGVIIPSSLRGNVESSVENTGQVQINQELTKSDLEFIDIISGGARLQENVSESSTISQQQNPGDMETLAGWNWLEAVGSIMDS
jgi:hypothetical protein